MWDRLGCKKVGHVDSCKLRLLTLAGPPVSHMRLVADKYLAGVRVRLPMSK